MFSSLRFRLWLTYVLVAVVVITIAGVAVVVYLWRNPTQDRREVQRLRLVSQLMLQRSQILNLPQGLFAATRLQDSLQRADEALGVRIAVFASTGDLLADSRADVSTPLPDWSTLKQRKFVTAASFRDADRKQWLYTLTPMESGNYLLVAVPRSRTPVLSIMRDEFLKPFLRGLLLALFLSLIFAFWIAHWVTAPLQRMADATRSILAGKFRKIPLEGPLEVQSVAGAFNEMGERVQASQRSQRDFIANVSHDLKTPLTSIQGFAQAILDGTADDPEAARQAADVIYNEAGRMHRMVLELLELARLDSGVVVLERKPLDLGEMLQGIVEKFTPQARGAQVNLVLRFAGSQGDTLPSGYLPIIIGDSDRLGQVFSNLVDNALKHTPSGGQVEVTARPVSDWVEVWVSDTGPGIPADELERIFERFYQTDKARRGGVGRGVGLGLAIAREIVQAHGGSISAHNREQGEPEVGEARQGSVFLVRLPIERPDDVTLVRRRGALQSSGSP